jgi:hypothetical protein
MQKGTRTALAVEFVHLDTALNQLRKAIAVEPDMDIRDRLTEAAATVAHVNRITSRRSADLAEAELREAPTEQEK